MAGAVSVNTGSPPGPELSGAGLVAHFRLSARRHLVAADVAVGPGEILAVFGPSGAGKTTLLEALAGLVELEAGAVELNGERLAEAGRRIDPVALAQARVGFVRQPITLFPHLSVTENLAFGLAPARRRPRSVASPGAGIQTVAEWLGLAQFLDRRPAQLSGGQRQRLALGQALAMRPRCLLLDEPFTGLDAPWRRRLAAGVREFVRNSRIPGVLVSHDLAEAQMMATTLMVMDDGVSLACGDPALVVRQPNSARVAELVGYGPELVDGPGRVLMVHPDRLSLVCSPGGLSGRADDAVVLVGRVIGLGVRALDRVAVVELTETGSVGPVGSGAVVVEVKLERDQVEPRLGDRVEVVAQDVLRFDSSRGEPVGSVAEGL
jgi:ABC-type sulfate/molybdate transport systems ATPase subunit